MHLKHIIILTGDHIEIKYLVPVFQKGWHISDKLIVL